MISQIIFASCRGTAPTLTTGPVHANLREIHTDETVRQSNRLWPLSSDGNRHTSANRRIRMSGVYPSIRPRTSRLARSQLSDIATFGVQSSAYYPRVLRTAYKTGRLNRPTARFFAEIGGDHRD